MNVAHKTEMMYNTEPSQVRLLVPRAGTTHQSEPPSLAILFVHDARLLIILDEEGEERRQKARRSSRGVEVEHIGQSLGTKKAVQHASLFIYFFLVTHGIGFGKLALEATFTLRRRLGIASSCGEIGD